MLVSVLITIVAYIAGALSHKWAAAIYAKETGRDAQADANTVKADVKKVGL